MERRVKTIVFSQSQFDRWYLRHADQVLFAGCSADSATPGDIPLYEGGHTLFEGGHPIMIQVGPEVLKSEFELVVLADRANVEKRHKEFHEI